MGLIDLGMARRMFDDKRSRFSIIQRPSGLPPFRLNAQLSVFLLLPASILSTVYTYIYIYETYKHTQAHICIIYLFVLYIYV